MVDFQSRDTNRGYGSDDEEEEDEVESEEAPVEPDPGDTTGTPGEQHASAPAETTTAAGDATDHPPTDVDSAAYAVVTITNERSLSDDSQGDSVVETIEDAGDRVPTRDLVQSGYDNVQSTVSTLAQRSDIDIVVTIGGTGVESSDVTVEALTPLFEKRLPGFGELFRLLAHETEGTAVVGTRVTAGIIDQTPVFVLPGTVTGVQLGMDEIVLPEGRHLAADATPHE
jgi:molybdenum cofactor biosynthesis protein B